MIDDSLGPLMKTGSVASLWLQRLRHFSLLLWRVGRDSGPLGRSLDGFLVDDDMG